MKKRVQTLASMVFFSAPQVTTDDHIGRITPFHGMDDAAFNNLMGNEDTAVQSTSNRRAGSNLNDSTATRDSARISVLARSPSYERNSALIMLGQKFSTWFVASDGAKLPEAS